MFVNLTPHAITLQAADGSRHTVPSLAAVVQLAEYPSTEPGFQLPSGVHVPVRVFVARIASTPGGVIITEGAEGFPSGIPIHQSTVHGEPEGIPPVIDGVTYIVSALFAGRVGSRIDVVYPGTGPADGCVRDSKGLVEAVTRLIRA